ncbi:MAG: hypothetical protein RQ731_07440 [Anaerosomatales bacterium]|nr:hypothetical protein [Anaerosomatales bacterium]MDT8434569.1 hypothetical protein [Anaerosomatales bacterium]
MPPTGKGFAYGVSISLVLILVGLPVSFAGMVLTEPVLLRMGGIMVGGGLAAVVVLLVALGNRSEATD